MPQDRYRSKADLPWPSKGDTLLADAGADQEWIYNACLMGPDAWMLARSYRYAAHELFQHIDLTEGRHLNDAVVLPILFMWRHFLELASKTLLAELVSYNHGLSSEIRRTHRLDQLWKDLRRELVTFAGDGHREEFDAVEAIISEFVRHDPMGIEFRYATDGEGRPTQNTLPARINLKNLDRVMQGVANFLDGADSMLQSARDSRQQYQG